jgi:hypothetical protein
MRPVRVARVQLTARREGTHDALLANVVDMLAPVEADSIVLPELRMTGVFAFEKCSVSVDV